MRETVLVRRCRLIALGGLIVVSATVAAAAPSKQPRLTFTSPVSGLAIERGSLWVSIAGDGVVLRLDARTGRRLARIDVHRADLRALGGGTLAAGPNTIWIAAPVHVEGDPAVGDASGWIGRIDPGTLRLKLVQVHGDRPAQVAVGRAGVWVSGGRTLRRINPADGRVVGNVRFRKFLGAVAVTRAAVWVAWANTGRLLRIDPKTRAVRASIRVGYCSAGSSLAVAGGRVWAATDRGLVSVETRSGRIASRIPLPGTSAVAFDGSRLWAVATGGVYSIHDGIVTKRLPLSAQVFGLIAAANGDVWLTDEASNSLTRVPAR